MNDTTTSRMFLATAALAAVAALLAGPANAVLLDVEGGSGGGAPAAAPTGPGTIPYLSHGIGVDESQFAGTAATELTGVHAALNRDRRSAGTSGVEPGTIPYLSHGIGVDESKFSGQPRSRFTGTWPGRVADDPQGTVTGPDRAAQAPGLDPAIQTAIQARAGRSTADTASTTSTPLPHGIGVEQTWHSGQPSYGLSGDSALTRVSAPEPEGLTGDSVLTRVDPVGGTTGVASSGDDFDWTLLGYGGGAALLLAAGLTAIYLSARRRGGGVALP